MGLTSLFVQTIRHWQSFHIYHIAMHYKKHQQIQQQYQNYLLCYALVLYAIYTSFLSSKAVEIKLKLIKYAMMNLPSKV